MSRKSAHHFVLVGFFLCVVLFASRNVLLFHGFRSSAPAISSVDLGRVFLILPDTLSVTGFLDGPGWWLPFSPLFLFSSFGLKLSHVVYVCCLRGNLFRIVSLLGTVLSFAPLRFRQI